MPELPEVETMRRGIAPIRGGVIERVTFPRCSYRPILVEPARATLRRKLRGSRILEIDRRGKRVVLVIEGAQRLVFEPRMTGLLLLTDPPDRTHVRLGMTLGGVPASQLWFWDRRGLGTVRLMSDEAYATRLGPKQLGPDALEVSLSQFRAQFDRSARAIKVALLDQKALAGIGNLYASEILHVARVSPTRTCNSVRPQEWAALHAATREVLQQAIKYEGSTLGDGTYRNALNQDGSYQNHHRVYKRADEGCPRCGDVKVIRIVQAQRSTFYCPACQK
ncbi:MAG: bifunctional DNA-formamidopyrimidine glycosylase/DNA-(apurinic or apyrimidinic site) lyase [Planctomycetota bacterium]